MAFVPYEELEGSPTIEADRKGMRAQRKVRIDWDRVGDFFLELFPDPYLGYRGSAYFPGYPWLTVDKVAVEPFDPARPSGLQEPMNVFPGGARVTVSYATPGEDRGMEGRDHSGPGGQHGSSGGQHGQDQAFVTHKISVGGEFITWPSKALRWNMPKKGLFDQDAPLAKAYEVAGDTQVGAVSPHIEHSIHWHFVPWPPWAAIRQCIGKVNAYAFAGAPRGTLLFLGGELSQDITPAGVKAWSMEYKFIEKNQNAINPLRPQGWNYFLRPDGSNAGTFQQICKVVPIIELYGPGSIRSVPATELAVGMLQTSVVMSVNDASKFPTSGQFRVVVDPNPLGPAGGVRNNWEEMAVLAGQGTNTWIVMRGLEGDPVRSHALGANVIQYSGRVFDGADFRFLFVPGIPL